MKQKPRLSIVIGALNEEQRITQTLQELRAYLVKTDLLQATELVMVTADATDNTHALVAKLLKRFPISQHLKPGARVGKGRDIAYGMVRAKGELCIFMDADLATPVEYIAITLAVHEAFPNDILIGSRDLRTIHTGFRTFMSLFGNFLFRLTTGIPVRDTQCGFKAVKHSTAHKLFKQISITGWGFDMEFLAMATAQQYRIRELPILEWQDKPHGSVANSPLRAAMYTMRELLKIAYRYRTNRYR